MRTLLTMMIVALVASAANAQITVFDHDFSNATPGNLSGTGNLGTPNAGTISATGGIINNFTYTTGSNGASNQISTVPDGSFNDVGTPGGNVLTANLSSAAAVTSTLGAGQTTTVDFQIASFGTNNANNFKYGHIVGLSSTGAEVFQILWRAGSNAGFRELYARELGQDNTTFSGGAFSSVDGTVLLDNVSFGINSTTNAPAGRVGVSITIDEFGWNASAAPTGGTSTQTPASGLGIASGATDLSSIVFFSSQNASNGTQNNGLWVDNINVTTDLKVIPEPTSFAVLMVGGLGLLSRRRR